MDSGDIARIAQWGCKQTPTKLLKMEEEAKVRSEMAVLCKAFGLAV